MLDHCKAIAKRAGIDPATFDLKTFRSTYATRMLRAGFDVRTVQHWMGHRSLETTMKYLAPARDVHDRLVRVSRFDRMPLTPATKLVDRRVLEMVHSSQFGHRLGGYHFDDSSLEARGILRNDRKVSLNGVSNVGQCFVFGLALGNATRQTWHPNSDAFLRPLQCNRVSHTSSLP